MGWARRGTVRLRRLGSALRRRVPCAMLLGARLAASGVVLTISGSGCRLHTAQAPVAEQARAPDFELPAHDGRTVTLAELVARGPAVLVFYRGHW
jgi:hypothetical protein